MPSRRESIRFRAGDSGTRFPEQVELAVARFGAAVGPLLRADVGQSEANITSAVETLLRDVAKLLGLNLLAHREASHQSLGVRPDLAIDVAGARVGVVELKAPGLGVPGAPRWGKARDRAQWEKLKALPNVLYTDGADWAVYHYGKQVGTTARLQGDLTRAGKKLRPADEHFSAVLHDFLWWEPNPPRDLSDLIKISAGLCHLLRDEVEEALRLERQGGSKALFSEHLSDWQEWLFPDLTDKEFVDAYAQTITFGLLLARREGILFEGLEISDIGERLAKKHLLVGRALSILTARPDRGRSVEQRSMVLQTMRRVIGVADWTAWPAAGTYHWLYEAFLERYDPKIRRQTGAYYTPLAVTNFMTHFVDEILEKKLNVPQGISNHNVVVLDPAMGTGTFLQSVIDRVASTVGAEGGDVPASLRALLPRLIGFERQIGPFAVAELKLNQALDAHAAEAKDEDFRLYVADTLDDPTKLPLPSHARLYAPLANSRRAANRVKTDEPLMVVMGNPPYRTQARKYGKWVLSRNPGQASLLDAFRHPGNGAHEHKLHDLAIYFWRWALWKAFESTPSQPAGIVAFITTHAYLDGPGFAGMRRYLRQQADFGWIIDLSTEGHWSSKQSRIFPEVPHPVCIGVFARGGKPNLVQSAEIRYLAIAGNQDDKFARLKMAHLDDPDWVLCPTHATASLKPEQDVSWTRHPALEDLMPFTSLGVTCNRAWVHSPSREVLAERWGALIAAPPPEKKKLLKETRDRNIDKVLPAGAGSSVGSIREETSLSPRIERFGFRSFDRQYLIADPRVVDFLRTKLWQIHGPSQLYMVTQLRERLTSGPGVVFSADVPDTHHFKGHHGGRVMPLYRDFDGQVANVVPGLKELLGNKLKLVVSNEDIVAYFAGVLAHSGYTKYFATELTQAGVRVPLTSKPDLWQEGVTIGRQIIYLHTFGERFQKYGSRNVKLKRPKVLVPVPGSREEMPETVEYDQETRALKLGRGRIGPISAAAANYNVSGMPVLKHWTDYRKRHPAGRVGGSDLDHLTADRWTLAMTEELRDLVAVLEGCVALETQQGHLLERIASSPVLTETDLINGRVLPPEADVRGPTAIKKDDVLF
jgi:type ISP restriction-modification system protein/N-6 DNA methylase